MSRNSIICIFVIFLFQLLLTGCDRRELYVYGDDFHSVELEVDWSNYVSNDPDGMTVWFYPLDDPSHPPYSSTTANVRRYAFYLPRGHYQGVVIDYSPEEYSHQRFLDMDDSNAARVEVMPMDQQPDTLTVAGPGVPEGLSNTINEQLFGETAWPELLMERPATHEENGLYTVANQPEKMGLDTLLNRYVDNGEYDEYIPWRERDSYQSSLVVKEIYAEPSAVVWKLLIRVWIRNGFNYLWQTPASVAGLADGHFLLLHVNTENPCLMRIDEWNMVRTGDNTGYIETTVNTFGLRTTHENRPGDMRLNLSFVLRDHATVVNYHFDVGNNVQIFDGRLQMQLEIGPLELPYADPYDGAGFGADVTPWENEPDIDVEF